MHDTSKTRITEEQYDFLGLLDLLKEVLGEQRRNALLKEDFSGMDGALEQAQDDLNNGGGENERHLAAVAHWRQGLSAGELNVEFPTLADALRCQQAAQVRWVTRHLRGSL